ncbi:MAG: 2-hydroxyglutaryl-CoA dehydratase [Desulfobacteraceae bacterium]|nr:2-hydroxyglutaryl-CoA dehydratase [Desulfobacteraceae bacterium]
MIAAGVDIGAATAKAVILHGKRVLSFSIIPSGHNVGQAGELVLRKALEKVGLSFNDVHYIISTGYGRRAISFADKAVSEIICHAAGVNSIMPNARTIIDIGGQDSKVMAIDGKGMVLNFVMNDKCAAGTGRFLEVMAKVLTVKIDNMGSISLGSKDPCKISSTCTVFAESEVVSLRAEGRSREDLLAGIHKAMSHRVVVLGKSLGFNKEVVFSGGVAKNIGIKKAMENEIGLEIQVPEEPQIVGALGAAILAKANLERRGKSN